MCVPKKREDEERRPEESREESQHADQPGHDELDAPDGFVLQLSGGQVEPRIEDGEQDAPERAQGREQARGCARAGTFRD